MFSKPVNSKPLSIEQRSIQLGGKTITYILKRSPRRRSIGLQINDQGLTVSMPVRASEKWLHSVLQEKAAWVVDKLDNWQDRQLPAQKWEDGETVLFRGENFTLRIVSGLVRAAPQLTASELIIPVYDTGNRKVIVRKLLSWFKQEAEQVFRECIEHYSPLMGVSPSAVKLTSARTQWGSCTVDGVVRLNWQLVTMPLHLIDYVVVHELAHLTEMNHSAAFWKLVERACPDYREIRAELRQWSPSTPEL